MPDVWLGSLNHKSSLCFFTYSSEVGIAYRKLHGTVIMYYVGALNALYVQ